MQKPLVCATLRGRTVEEMVNDAPKAIRMGADILEIRLDLLWSTEERIRKKNVSEEGEKEEIEVIFNQLELSEIDYESAITEITSSIEAPLLMACRSKSQGGFFPGDEKERAEVLKSAIANNPSWIDLEIDIDPGLREILVNLTGDSTKVIASYHSMKGAPSSSEIYKDVIDAQELGDLVKVCYSISDRRDALRIFESALDLKSSTSNYSLMGLGPGGDWARIHAPVLGQELVFATTESGWHLAQQGNINASDLMIAWEVMGYN